MVQIMEGVLNPAEIAYEMPASTAQRYICLNAGENPAAWNIAVRFMLRGHLDVPQFEAAIQHLVAQNEILRTGLAVRDGGVVQQIAERCLVQFAFFDVSDEGGAASPEVDRISKEEARRTFDLEQPPMMRAVLLRLAPAEHMLLLTLHHAVCDGWSVGLITEGIMKAYGELNAGNELTCDDSALQYGDYAVAENEYRDTDAYGEHARFWQEKLSRAKVFGGKDLPLKSGPAETEIFSRVLPLSLTGRVAELARHEGLTFFEVALSAFALALMRHEGRREAIFATPVSGRNSVETEKMTGTFVNYLPISIAGEPRVNLSAFRSSVAHEMSDLLAHAEFRTEDLMLQSAEALRLFFDHVFICQRDFVHTVEGGGVELSAVPSVSPGALHPMTFFLVERADGWRMSCEIDRLACSSADAEAMLGCFEEVLSSFTGDEKVSVGAVTGAAEEEELTSAVRQAFEAPASLAQQRYWMLQQVQEQGALHLRVRLRIEGEFRPEIARQAFQTLVNRHEILRTTVFADGETLKQHIHPEGVAPDIAVRSLTGQKAQDGGAAISEWLRSEDHYNFEEGKHSWLRVLIVETAPSEWILAITMPHLLGDGWSCGLLLREFYRAYEALRDGREVEFKASPMQYAEYAMNESRRLSSGVMQKRMEWWKSELPARMMPLDIPADPDLAGRDETGVEVIVLDPMLAAAVKQFARDENSTLFSIYGAALLGLLSKYTGQTEISIVTPFANRSEETENVIGPFATPVLVHSAMRPEWSFREFLNCFRSGAMASFENALPLESCLELTALQSRLGRHAANQISFFFQSAFVSEAKMSGFTATPMPLTSGGSAFEWQIAVVDYGRQVRIEFQYDTNLWSAASVRQVAEHYQRLLSECIFHAEMPLSEASICTDDERMMESSPERLLPISRRALHLGELAPQLETLAAQEPAVRAEPRTDLERTLVTIWRGVFLNREIGVQDNFFSLGGHSLTLARVRAHLQKATGHSITAADIFAAPTIAQLAQRLESNSERPAQSSVVPLRAEGAQPPLFLISQSMVFRRMVQWLHPDQPVFTVVMQDEDLKNGARTTFEEIAGWYVARIRSAQPSGPYRLGGWCVSSWLAYEIAQQLRRAGEGIDLLLLVDGWAPGYWRSLGWVRRRVAKSNYYASRMLRHARTLAGMSFSGRLGFISGKWRLTRAALARQLAAVLYRAGLGVKVAAEVQTTFADQVVYAASRAYRAKPTDVVALVFRSNEQPQGRFLPQDLGWSALLGRRVEAISLPGDHEEIFNDPGAEILARQIAQALSLPMPSAPAADGAVFLEKCFAGGGGSASGSCATANIS